MGMRKSPKESKKMKILSIEITGKNGDFRIHRMKDIAVQVTRMSTGKSEVVNNAEDLALIIDGNLNSDEDVYDLTEAVQSALGVKDFS